MLQFYFSEIELSLSYNRDMSYTVTIGDKKYVVVGDLTKVDDKTMMNCDIDGVKSSANVLLNGDSLHVFTAVSSMCS